MRAVVIKEDALKLARAYTTNVDPEQNGMSMGNSAQLELFSDGKGAFACKSSTAPTHNIVEEIRSGCLRSRRKYNNNNSGTVTAPRINPVSGVTQVISTAPYCANTQQAIAPYQYQLKLLHFLHQLAYIVHEFVRSAIAVAAYTYR